SAVLIVAPNPIEASLVARRLAAWGARTAVVADEGVAAALIPERRWDTLLFDGALGIEAAGRLIPGAAARVARCIVRIPPADRHELGAFKAAGFTGYLLQPLRAGSLATRFPPAAD